MQTTRQKKPQNGRWHCWAILSRKTTRCDWIGYQMKRCARNTAEDLKLKDKKDKESARNT